MADWLQIANLALRELGADAIASLTDDEEAARLVNDVYQLAADEVLARHPWNCAQARASLAADGAAPSWGYAYQYTLPTDPWCLRVWRLEESTTEFKVEGRKLLTDAAAPLKLLYIKRITDPGELAPWVIEPIAAKIAARIAFKLTNSRSAEADMKKWFAEILKEARSLDGQEGTPEGIEADDFLGARY